MLFLFDFNNLYAILENVIGANLVVIRKNVVFFSGQIHSLLYETGCFTTCFLFFSQNTGNLCVRYFNNIPPIKSGNKNESK